MRVGAPARAPISAAVLAAVVFLGVGLLGAFREIRGFWLYRGFPPPRYPA